MALRLISVDTARSWRLRLNTYSGSVVSWSAREHLLTFQPISRARVATEQWRPRNRHTVHPSRVHARMSWLSDLRDHSPVVGGHVVGADRAGHRSL